MNCPRHIPVGGAYCETHDYIYGSKDGCYFCAHADPPVAYQFLGSSEVPPADGLAIFHDASNGGRLSRKLPDGTVVQIVMMDRPDLIGLLSNAMKAGTLMRDYTDQGAIAQVLSAGDDSLGWVDAAAQLLGAYEKQKPPTPRRRGAVCCGGETG